MNLLMKTLRRLFNGLNRLLAWLFIGAVRLYQLALSPLIGRHCRFEPSCSKYFIAAIEKYGPIKGSLRGIWRICRCNPWNRGGFDPP
jgi:uncharacterized protein